MENLLVPNQVTVKTPGTRVLVLAPHPDDEVFGCGGAIMHHIEQGIPVHVIVVSDGGYGVSEEKATEYTLQRQHESIAAAKILNYGAPVFWQYQDRQVCYSEKFVQRIITTIKEMQVDLIYAPSVLEMHPDHRALGMATVEAVRRIASKIYLAMYEVGIPLQPNHLLDISTVMQRKLAAMACFVSQLEKQRYDLDIAALNRYRTYTLPDTVTAAEAYMLISAEELTKDPLKLYQSEYARQKTLGLTLDSRDTPLVSVIIRSMDRATLSDALDSVALQTYVNIEVVLVNAKGNGHREMDAWCGHFPLRMITSENGEPLSRSKAANIGLDAAKGEYLIFLDDDDWFEPHHIVRLEEKLDPTKNTIAVYSAIRCMDETGEEIRHFKEEFDPIQLHIDNFIPIHAVLFRRYAIDSGARFDEALTVCEDWDFWLQVLEYGTFQFVAKVGATYRMEKGKGSEVWRDAARTKKMMMFIYRKWMLRWSDATLWTILEYARCKNIINLRDREIFAINQVLDSRNQEIDNCAQIISERDQTIESLVFERDKTIESLISERDKTIESLISERDKTIESLISERDQTIEALNKVISEKYEVISERDQAIEVLNKVISEKYEVISERDQAIEVLNKQIMGIWSSTSWRITTPVRLLGNFIKNILARMSHS